MDDLAQTVPQIGDQWSRIWDMGGLRVGGSAIWVRLFGYALSIWIVGVHLSLSRTLSPISDTPILSKDVG